MEVNGEPVAIPSDSWTQLLVYRKDLFDQAGLAAPTTFQTIRAAADKLTGEDGGDRGRHQAGLLHPADLRVPGGGQQLPARRPGRLHHLDQQACLDTFQFYIDLIRSVGPGRPRTPPAPGPHLASRRPRSSGRRFCSTSLAGLSSDARPTCPQCHRDPSFLADHSGIVTAIRGPDGSEPSQFSELTCFASARTPTPTWLVEFMMNDSAWTGWLAPKAGSTSGPGPGSAAQVHRRGSTSRPVLNTKAAL